MFLFFDWPCKINVYHLRIIRRSDIRIVYKVSFAKYEYVFRVLSWLIPCSDEIRALVFYPRLTMPQPFELRRCKNRRKWLLTKHDRRAFRWQYSVILLPQLVKWYNGIPSAVRCPIRQIADHAIHTSVRNTFHPFEAVFIIYLIQLYHALLFTLSLLSPRRGWLVTCFFFYQINSRFQHVKVVDHVTTLANKQCCLKWTCLLCCFTKIQPYKVFKFLYTLS